MRQSLGILQFKAMYYVIVLVYHYTMEYGKCLNKYYRKKNEVMSRKNDLSRDSIDYLSRELDSFLSSELLEISFPTTLTSEERKYLHLKCAELGIKSKSHGQGPLRYITIYKKKTKNKFKKKNKKLSIIDNAASVEISSISQEIITKTCDNIPITKQMYEELLPNPMKQFQRMAVANCKRNLPLMCNKSMSIPRLATNENLLLIRKSLPIWDKRGEIIQAIENHPVVIITAETGSGKTTQIPQFIIDNNAMKNRPCRVVCCQPRRIAAISMADRVSNERGENIGMSIGYQVRLESCVSHDATIIYCTTGVLTRTLMDRHQKDNEPVKGMLLNVSHIIVDEVHERDKHVDFLLIALRMILPKNPHLKLILMSATADINLFSSYFDNCPVLKVEGKMFPVTEYFLEDILDDMNYESQSMLRIKNRTKIDYWDNNIVLRETTEAIQNMHLTEPVTTLRSDQEWLKPELDDCMHQIWFNAEIEQIDRMIYYIMSEGVPVDYQHSDTGVTLLMLVAVHGLNDYVIMLLNMGASPVIQTRVLNKDAATWAADFKQYETRDLILNYKGAISPKEQNEAHKELDMMERLELYKKSLPPSIHIDSYLIAHLVKHIILTKKPGSILVFLPGFEDMSMVNKVITEELIAKDDFKIKMYMLHSMMQTSDQQRVFLPVPKGYRKVILATNIVETSVTINDIVFVIDSGRVKQKGYNAFNGISCMNVNWISQSCAKQRAGRAGRLCPGECYRLYSRENYSYMGTHDVPEILRMPLQELCMLAKVISSNMRILDFLALAIQPPPTLSIVAALEYLKTIEAMDINEDLTALGFFMLDLSIEPHYAKSLVFAVFLKCLDPVLTIISCLANREPFNLTLNVNMKTSLGSIRKKLAGSTLSDHIILLRLYQAFNERSKVGSELNNLVSQSVMGLITQTRTQLLGQLRALELIQMRPGPNDIRDVNSNSNNWAAVKACLLAGLYPNLAKLDKSSPRPILKTKTEKSVVYHGSSILRENYSKDLPSEWIIFEEMCSFSTKKCIKNCTVVSPMAVALFANAMKIPHDSVKNIEDLDDSDWDTNDETSLPIEQSGVLNLDGWTTFVGNPDDITKILNIRLCLTLAYREFLKNKMITINSSYSNVVQSVVKILAAEDQAVGLEAPDDVGKRPRENSNKGRHGRHNDNSSFTSFRKLQPQNQYSHGYPDNSSYLTGGNNCTMNGSRGSSYRNQNNYSLPSTSQSSNNFKW
ncbi:3'-5' RNA helicase YTHDC2-like isoform X2 [Adelges cooleyi]|uniref:3'-5' RNA helicase YTHDC2-like isoform X2 n=1 Tax=Adelges cooleyi TaxID=133065 RepID=UPI00217F26E2|nr:3'-5' RNA helicase YTHDC2-like isoform X2 [Adelges cooleyi]